MSTISEQPENETDHAVVPAIDGTGHVGGPPDPSPYLVETGSNHEAEVGMPSDLLQAFQNEHLVSTDDFGSTLTTLHNGRQCMVRQEWDMNTSDDTYTYMLEMTEPGGLYTGEHATPITDAEQVHELKRLFLQDDGHVSNGLRQALESRLVTYEEDWRGKVVSVEYDGKTYEFSRDQTGDAWDVKVLVNGLELGTGIIHRKEWLDADASKDEPHPPLHDGAFLEAIWNQDIPDSLRAALQGSTTVEHDEFTKLCVEHDGKTYKFYHDPAQEYGEWAMDVYAGDDNRELMTSTQICEPTDVEYLNKLFNEKVGYTAVEAKL